MQKEHRLLNVQNVVLKNVLKKYKYLHDNRMRVNKYVKLYNVENVEIIPIRSVIEERRQLQLRTIIKKNGTVI